MEMVQPKWGFAKIRGTFLGVLIIRIIVFWGLYWGHPILGNRQMLNCHHESSSERSQHSDEVF